MEFGDDETVSRGVDTVATRAKMRGEIVDPCGSLSPVINALLVIKADRVARFAKFPPDLHYVSSSISFLSGVQ